MASKSPSSNRGEAGWQVERSLSECNKYMLEHRVGTDVTFAIHSQSGVVTEVTAHKYMLISRSPVFEAMFCGSLACSDGEDGKVRISDVDADAFEELLKFIYHEEANISTENVMPVLYAAKKYLVPPLSRRCMDFLERNICVENVCTILNHSLMYEEQELTDKCFFYIAPRAGIVMETDGFLGLCRLALQRFLECNFLHVTSESKVFEACISWAKERCKGDTNVTSETELRQVLGDVIRQIRFPCMDAKEFALTVGKTAILSDKEKADMYYFLLTGESVNMEFVKTPRLLRCIRYPSTGMTQGWWTCNGPSEAITFNVDRPIVLVGVSLYGGKEVAKHDVVIELRETCPDVLLQRCEHTMLSDGSQTPIPLFFEPMNKWHQITPSRGYTLVATMKGPTTHYGHCGKDLQTTGGYIFQFAKSGKSGNGTNVKNGQIPELLFLPATGNY